jgi:hyperosmotically inducible protein
VTNTKKLNLKFAAALAGMIILALADVNAGDRTPEPASPDSERVKQRIRKKLVNLSYYSAFDLINFRISDTTVVLSGYVNRPTLKIEAERVLLDLEEINEVENLIEVLPASSADDEIRVRAYSAIYGHPSLTRYAPGGGMTARHSARFRNELHFGLQSATQPLGPHPIHIIVKNGKVNLVGGVSRSSDKAVAESLVNSIPGVFSVTNDIQAIKG